MVKAQTKPIVKNAMSIDLEDWFCVHNLSGVIKKTDWDNCQLRVYESTKRILNLLDKHRTHATFFVLACVAVEYDDPAIAVSVSDVDLVR